MSALCFTCYTTRDNPALDSARREFPEEPTRSPYPCCPPLSRHAPPPSPCTPSSESLCKSLSVCPRPASTRAWRQHEAAGTGERGAVHGLRGWTGRRRSYRGYRCVGARCQRGVGRLVLVLREQHTGNGDSRWIRQAAKYLLWATRPPQPSLLCIYPSYIQLHSVTPACC